MRQRRLKVDVLLPTLLAMCLSGPLAANEVPFKGRLSGTSVFTFVSPTEVLEDFSGDGQATHLGRFTAKQQHTINLLTTEVLEGSFTFTAANGDTVSGSYSGQRESPCLPG